jgi:hypothetical protein
VIALTTACGRVGFTNVPVDAEQCDVAACPSGCEPAGRSCLRFTPSNLTTPDVFGFGSARLVVDQAWTINTDTGAITSDAGELRTPTEGDDQGMWFGVVDQPLPAPPLGVFAVRSLTILPTGTLVGIGGRSLLVIVDGDVDIEGTVSVAVSALPTATIAAGAFSGGRYGGPTDGMGPGHGTVGIAGGGGDNGGGGGAAFGSAGGRGGNTADIAGMAGMPYGTVELVPLLGGSGGGAAVGNTTIQGWGGDGGGAVQISATGFLRSGESGVVDASGGAGRGGSSCCAGGGAGAGGAILLEARSVVHQGHLAANGGSGGQGGGQGTGIDGLDGSPGSPFVIPAPGGALVNAGGIGGDGSNMAGAAMNGGGATNGGGGGGGAGRIRINTDPSGASLVGMITPTLASGLATVGALSD